MSNIKAVDRLRESSRLDDCKWTLGNGEIVFMVNTEPDDPMAVNWGEQWRKIADEIESEIAESFMPLPKDADGKLIRVGDVVTDGEEQMPVIAIASDEVATQRTIGPCEGQIWTFAPDALRHVKPRTLEDVLLEMLEMPHCEENVKAYAAEIRELMGVGE